MKHIKEALLCLSLIACGAAEDEWLTDELGEVGQAATAKGSDNLLYGTTTSGARLQCNRTSTGQVCTMPNTKNPTYCIEFGSGITNNQASQIRGAFSAFDTALSSWTFTDAAPAGVQNCGTLNPVPTVIVNKLACSGTLSSNIEGYSCANLTFVDSLSDVGIPGSFQRHSNGVIHLDYVDILNKGANATEDDRLSFHAILHGISAWIGQGSRSDSLAAGFASERAVTPFRASRSALRTGEDCRAESYLPGASSGNFLEVGPACGQD